MVDAPQTSSADEAELLRRMLDHLATRVRREQIETWFRSLLVSRVDEHEIELSVTSQFVRDWLVKNYYTALQEAVETASIALNNRAAGGGTRRFVLTHREEDAWDSLRLLTPLTLDGDAPAPRAEATTEPAARPTPPRPASGNQPVAPRRAGNPLNPNYTFDRFVVGSCNRLAHASALAIGENPGCAYNPLFVHGNVGLGKTHILQAICHTVVRRDPHARVIYMSCEDFTNAFIQAIQSQQLDQFREYYRGADVLVIDDVQFLANKDKTQDEFFHTFNALYDGQRQIVLSSDRPPVEIPTIEERLVSRFKWGLVAEVEAPCFDTRVTIVRHKAAGRGVNLPEEVARFLAERVTANIRELEGAVIKIVGMAAITGQPITLELAESCLRGMPVRRSQVSADEVMTLITSEFAITARELVGKGRTQTVSLPRQIAMFLLRQHTEASLEEIGRMFGNRDHTTVIYAVNKVRDRTQKDRLFKELLDNLGNRLLTRTLRA
jgi:chromosomal replication initiator protein